MSEFEPIRVESRPLEYDAIHFPQKSAFHAEKDHEELVRAVARFADSMGGALLTYSMDELYIQLFDDYTTVKPGDWLMYSYVTEKFSVVSDAQLHLFYRKVE